MPEKLRDHNDRDHNDHFPLLGGLIHCESICYLQSIGAYVKNS